MNATMTPAERFFYDHAGSCYDPTTETRAQGKRRGAVRLAQAEAYAAEHGWTVRWDDDDDGERCYETCDRAGTDHEHEILCAVLTDAAGDALASLGWIMDADRPYGRVVEAELASEALAEIEARAAHDREAARYLAL